jgi:hypothetical protein
LPAAVQGSIDVAPAAQPVANFVVAQSIVACAPPEQ